MKYFNVFLNNLKIDLCANIFWWVVFIFFRLLFLAVFSKQLAQPLGSDTWLALLLGFRLSLKTAGFITLFGVLLATLPKVFLKFWPAAKIRLLLHGLALLFFSFCFMARFPYYQIFHSAFDFMLINGLHDDKKAILLTALHEYGLVWRLGLALVLAVILFYLLRKLLNAVASLEEAGQNYSLKQSTAIALGIAVFAVFIRYGAAFNYAHSVTWENAARFHSNLLNEAVLDDGQALYRVYSINKRLAAHAKINFPAKELRSKIAAAGGVAQAEDIDTAFLRTVKIPKLEKPATNVVCLIGESFGLWPFLPQFQPLHLVDNCQQLQASFNGDYINSFLAHGSGTNAAVIGFLTGVPNLGAFVNYMPVTYQEQYRAGIGYIMKSLGYKTVFWYGGYSGWQNIKKFALAQSFDEFYCADEIAASNKNAWGLQDADFLAAVNAYIAQQAEEKVFHLILTTSNHPPYVVDVDKLGFPRQQVKKNLPADIADNDKNLTELGHMWYADKTMGEFVRQAEKEQANSLFIITGDHSERFDFAQEEDLRTLALLPCIFYGRGVSKDWFEEGAKGCHMQIAGTLAEILGPPGFSYSAYLENMFTERSMVFNSKFYLAAEQPHRLGTEDDFTKTEINNFKDIAAWRIYKGNKIE